MVDRVAVSIHWLLYNSDGRLGLSLLASVNLYCRSSPTCHWSTPISKGLDVILFAAELGFGDRLLLAGFEVESRLNGHLGKFLLILVCK
jgi:hypothetical protein